MRKFYDTKATKVSRMLSIFPILQSTQRHSYKSFSHNEWCSANKRFRGNFITSKSGLSTKEKLKIINDTFNRDI